MHSRMTCRCGHALAAHEHLRRGSDCSLCARGTCRAFRSAYGWRTRLLAWARQRLG